VNIFVTNFQKTAYSLLSEPDSSIYRLIRTPITGPLVADDLYFAGGRTVGGGSSIQSIFQRPGFNHARFSVYHLL
jgi:hypothetical protein